MASRTRRNSLVAGSKRYWNIWNEKPLPEKITHLKYWIIASILYAVLIVSTSVYEGFVVTTQSEIDSIDKSIEFMCSSMFSVFEETWRDTGMFSIATKSLFAARNYSIERHEFKQHFVFLSNNSYMFERAQALQAISWIPYTETDQERVLLEEATRNYQFANLSDYRFHNGASGVTPNNTGPYFPVHYIEPLEGNAAALGFNLVSNPVREAAINAARTSAQSVATGRIVLVQEDVKQPQFAILYFTPMYFSESDVSTFNGLISAVYKIGNMLSNAIKTFDLKDVNLYVFDKIDEDTYHFLAHHSGSGGYADIREYAEETKKENIINERDWYKLKTYELSVGGRTWEFVCAPTTQYLKARRTNTAWTIFLLSLALGLTQDILQKILFQVYTRSKVRAIQKSDVYIRRTVKTRMLSLSSQSSDLNQVRTSKTNAVCPATEDAP